MMSFYKSRQRVDIRTLQPENILIEDIAHDLAIIPRFAGGTARPYSVAEHSIMVMQMVEDECKDPAVLMQALLHDATEYIIGDIPAPVKVAVPELSRFENTIIWPAIARRFDLPVDLNPLIKAADWVALYVEAYCLRVTDSLNQWENYPLYWLAAETWMERYGEIAHDNMPHPAMIEEVFLNCFNTLLEAREQGVTELDLSGDMEDVE